MATRQPAYCIVDYCNDVFGDLLSLCILQEVGYEGDDTIVYIPLPGPFVPLFQKLVVDKMHDLFYT